ncbi:MAG TPA: DUF4476 domain-containing protein [Bacteroidetes bacterium]|nr:DUF4476 domain-containing protein [Bacteroidota bacterium]
MKKLILFTAFLFTVSFGMSQLAINSYHGNPPSGGNIGYNSGNNHGPPAMHPEDFRYAMRSVEAQSFEQERFRVAKQIIKRNNLRSSQVKRLIGLMSFESSRLKLAKVGYTRVSDPDRYYIVNDEFRFSSSVRNLDNYIASVESQGYGDVAYGGGSCGSPATQVYGQSGHTTYSGSVTVTSGHGGMGINHGAGTIVSNVGPPACGMCQGHHVVNHYCNMGFGRILRSIKKQCFDRNRIMVAQQALGDKMINTSMVIQVMDLLSFESSKLEFAKFAYHNTWDLGNFYQVNDAFSFSSSIRALDRYIRYNG